MSLVNSYMPASSTILLIELSRTAVMSSSDELAYCEPGCNGGEGGEGGGGGGIRVARSIGRN